MSLTLIVVDWWATYYCSTMGI